MVKWHQYPRQKRKLVVYSASIAQEVDYIVLIFILLADSRVNSGRSGISPGNILLFAPKRWKSPSLFMRILNPILSILTINQRSRRYAYTLPSYFCGELYEIPAVVSSRNIRRMWEVRIIHLKREDPQHGASSHGLEVWADSCESNLEAMKRPRGLVTRLIVGLHDVAVLIASSSTVTLPVSRELQFIIYTPRVMNWSHFLRTIWSFDLTVPSNPQIEWTVVEKVVVVVPDSSTLHFLRALE